LALSKCFTESTFLAIGTDRDRKTEALGALLAYDDLHCRCAFIALDDMARESVSGTFEQLRAPSGTRRTSISTL
jgi:hypothetical protein